MRLSEIEAEREAHVLAEAREEAAMARLGLPPPPPVPPLDPPLLTPLKGARQPTRFFTVVESDQPLPSAPPQPPPQPPPPQQQQQQQQRRRRSCRRRCCCRRRRRRRHGLRHTAGREGRGVGWWGWCRGVGRREEPAAAAGGVRGASPVALGVPSARGRAAGGSRGRPACLDASSCMKIAKKIATVTLSLCMGWEVREG